MPLPIELVQLRERLQDIGMVVVEEPDYLSIRLPYFCSVRIYSTDGRLRFEPFFGLVPRTRATMVKIFMFTSFTLLSFKAGVPYALALAMLGIMSCIYDVIRVMVTENVITRAGLTYGSIVHPEPARQGIGPTSPTRALGQGTAPTVPAVNRDPALLRRDR